jgi:hypothetical protein
MIEQDLWVITTQLKSRKIKGKKKHVPKKYFLICN